MGAVLGIILPHLAEERISTCKYTITPIFKNKNEYYIALNGIFFIKIVHIINNYLKGNGKQVKEERTKASMK